MSTFDGLVSEFPDIRIDFFRRHSNRTPPLVCFLSHVHSDHLAGLDTLRSPFVYCSPATREILLRLEKYTCRINYVQGILEARQQTYRHLRKVLKALPLETPTTMELRPGYKIQVTLFDANHCPGSTMFLIEGEGKAILYTGDIRAESWFVNSIARNPTLLEYTHGLKTLDKLYLDTSFIEDVPFQTKSEGIAELLKKVRKYPSDTIFHFQAWTFGYEEVWIALSKALNSRVHVDDYKLRIFRSLNGRSANAPFSADLHLTIGAAALNGHMCGNSQHPGCLTSDEHVRIHSCEKANMCSVAKRPGVVSIRPVVFRLPNGDSIKEAGVGGGGKDFSREAELDLIANKDIGELFKSLPKFGDMDGREREEIFTALQAEAASGRRLSLNMTIGEFDDNLSIGLKDTFCFLRDKIRQESSKAFSEQEDEICPNGLPKVILFPFARHSPYRELCHLASILKPKDIWPCTVDGRWKERGVSIQSLFGKFCSEQTFEHDQEMSHEGLLAQEQKKQKTPDPTSQWSASDGLDDCPQSPVSGPAELVSALGADQHWDDTSMMEPFVQDDICTSTGDIMAPTANDVLALPSNKRPWLEPSDDAGAVHTDGEQDSQRTDASTMPGHTSSRYEAYQAMLSNSAGTGPWMPISLLSTDASHGVADTEL